MKTVYLLRSTQYPQQRYIGITDDLDRRLAEHNSGRSAHTSRYAPWEVVVAVPFQNAQKALEFEKYLKIGSGHAFATSATSGNPRNPALDGPAEIP